LKRPEGRAPFLESVVGAADSWDCLGPLTLLSRIRDKSLPKL
jgi:hypothetical protein